MKNLFLLSFVLITWTFATKAQVIAQPGSIPPYAHYQRSYPSYPTYPVPYPAPYPRPYPTPYPQPYIVTCYAEGLTNGLVFYGLGQNVYIASQRAMLFCQSSGQYCQPIGCR